MCEGEKFGKKTDDSLSPEAKFSYPFPP